MTTHPDFKLFSEFPLDIQRLVFEEAFEESHRKAIHITLVSRAVRSWIEPLMYQCITLNRHTYTKSERRQFRLFANTFQGSSKPKDFYAKYVQRLFIDDLQKWNLAEELVPLCSNLKSLACWASPSPANQSIMSSLFSPDVLSHPLLCRLSIYCGSLPPTYRSFRHPIFRNLTHLDIDYVPNMPWEGLSSLGNLQYFNLDCIFACLIPGGSIQNIAHELECIIIRLVPFFPVALRCFIALVPSHVIKRFVSDEADETCRARQIYVGIASGQYDKRIVLGSSSGIPPTLLQHKEEKRDFIHRVVSVPYELSAWTYLPKNQTDFWMEADRIIETRKQEVNSQPINQGEVEVVRRC